MLISEEYKALNRELHERNVHYGRSGKMYARMVDFLLAEGSEGDAKRLLRETGPSGVTEEDVLRELGARYALVGPGDHSPRLQATVERKPERFRLLFGNGELQLYRLRWEERAVSAPAARLESVQVGGGR